MTSPEMNAHQAKKIVGGLAVAASLVGLGGCASAFNPETDAASPVAPRVQALVDANREYPRWEDFPRSSEPLPEPVEVASRVGALRSSGSDLAAEAARIDWQLGDPTAFAAEVNSRVDAQQISPVTAETQAEVEAFARRTRQRGTAPPPVDRGPAPR
ncbi:hypothetical protein [Brevundimonas sp. NIBR11]|uniref:hypothetical protein n=1 Tax=Brevundimonas sp. NIBR11 TaxID=3015999 RepID=UPI0022F08F57|nr:hypothetical protein [Brevundimonas sp. NIBR11]WGM31078.1 hypothetical protein KKHFBJBL_01315 [Brevundimonas sp. NIBR11]